ncbi:MAG: transposase [Patescibacteria group bacterium]
MPQKNSRKTYVEHGHYHVYNRGVEKREIFASPQDYKVFLNYLREYLSQPILNDAKQDQLKTSGDYYSRRNYGDVITLEAFALMPNHFHLLVHQSNMTAMKDFLQSLSSRYCVYFNKRYERVGSLFQGRYKAVLVKTDEQLAHLSRYINLNPLDLGVSLDELRDYPYCSYANYLERRENPWLDPGIPLGLFAAKDKRDLRSTSRNYQFFIEDYAKAQDDLEVIQHLTLD